MFWRILDPREDDDCIVYVSKKLQVLDIRGMAIDKRNPWSTPYICVMSVSGMAILLIKSEKHSGGPGDPSSYRRCTFTWYRICLWFLNGRLSFFYLEKITSIMGSFLRTVSLLPACICFRGLSGRVVPVVIKNRCGLAESDKHGIGVFDKFQK